MRIRNPDNVRWPCLRWLGIITILFLSLCLTSAAFGGEIAIIKADNPTKRITPKDLKKILLGKMKKWRNGDKVVIVTLAGGDVHEAFIKRYASKTPKQFINYWRKMVFSGKGKMPKKFKTQEKLIHFVAENKGAIGYIDSATAQKGVKELELGFKAH